MQVQAPYDYIRDYYAQVQRRIARDPKARDYAVEAIKMSTGLGPVAHAEVVLAGAMILYQLKSPETAEALERSCQAFQQLGLQASESRARLALACLDPDKAGQHAEKALNFLFEPAHIGELSQAVVWLLPDMVHLAAGPGCLSKESVRRLALDFPVARRNSRGHG